MSDRASIAISCKEAARLLGVSKTQLWRLVASGQIRKVSHRTISVSELTRYVTRKTV